MSNYETTSEFQKMLERLAALTDSDLLDCIKTPDILDDQTEGHSYFLSRLRHARYVASKCVDGIIERGIVSKAGNLAMA